MIDPRLTYSEPPRIGDQAANAANVTPSDSVDLSPLAKALYIGGGGTVRVTMVGGQTVDFLTHEGQLLPILVRRVHATETTATGIVALW